MVLVAAMAVLSIILATTQIFLKRLITTVVLVPGPFWERVGRTLGSQYLWIAGAGLVVGFAMWLLILPKVKLSIAYPMVSFSYVAMLFLAHFIEGEPIRWTNAVGVALIVGGVVFLAWGK